MVVEEHFALNNEENTQIKSEKKKSNNWLMLSFQSTGTKEHKRWAEFFCVKDQVYKRSLNFSVILFQ
jgi:hypothetical protein